MGAETFHVSSDAISRMRRRPFVVAAFLALVAGPVVFGRAKSLVVAATVVGVAVALVAFVFWLRLRDERRWAAGHRLLLDADGFVVCDGADEVRVPWTAVEKVFVNLRSNQPAGVVLEIRDRGRERLPDYDRLERLAQLLRERVPVDRVEERRIVHA